MPGISNEVAEWLVEPLDGSHERMAFCCGQPSLDAFLHSLVRQYDKRHLGKTYVAVRGDSRQVWGYYTLAAGAVSFGSLPPVAGRKLPRHPVPVILLARLAVDQAVAGQGLGRHLLVDALERCLYLAGQLGVYAVEVDAIDQTARVFYEKYGFVALQDSLQHLYLPVSTVKEAFAGRREAGLKPGSRRRWGN